MNRCPREKTPSMGDSGMGCCRRPFSAGASPFRRRTRWASTACGRRNGIGTRSCSAPSHCRRSRSSGRANAPTASHGTRSVQKTCSNGSRFLAIRPHEARSPQPPPSPQGQLLPQNPPLRRHVSLRAAMLDARRHGSLIGALSRDESVVGASHSNPP